MVELAAISPARHVWFEHSCSETGEAKSQFLKYHVNMNNECQRTIYFKYLAC